MTTPTLWTQTTENSLLPQYFVPPSLNPSPGGLWASVSWTDEGPNPPRWLMEGIALRSAVVGNYSGELSSGAWDQPFCGEPGSGSGGDIKTGVRPDDPETFYATTVWSFDACDLTPASRAETTARVAQVLRMREPILVARVFAGRLLDDAGVPVAAADLTAAVGEIECLFAAENTLGCVHASPMLLTHLVSHQLVMRGGVSGWATPGGHAVIFDGGYREVIGDKTLVATSAPLLGWRDQVQIREIPDTENNTFISIAERSSIVTYEQPLGAVTVEVGS